MPSVSQSALLKIAVRKSTSKLQTTHAVTHPNAQMPGRMVGRFYQCYVSQNTPNFPINPPQKTSGSRRSERVFVFHRGFSVPLKGADDAAMAVGMAKGMANTPRCMVDLYTVPCYYVVLIYDSTAHCTVLSLRRLSFILLT